jgi:hypothetical protein
MILARLFYYCFLKIALSKSRVIETRKKLFFWIRDLNAVHNHIAVGNKLERILPHLPGAGTINGRRPAHNFMEQRAE